ncbi:MAG TPA: glycosyltransferase 87 family protein [Ktedonobacterales bacterium]|nr:glycosyltransferase 87 family protein [Ktedonobacterales bacterium]
MATTIALSRRVSALRLNWLRLLARVESDPRLVTRALAGVWLVTRGLLFIGMLAGRNFCDPWFYHYAGEFAAGRLPYRDVPVEYPPVTIALLLLPALPLLPFASIAPRPDAAFAPGFTHLPHPDPTRYLAYGVSFACEMLVIDALTLWLVRRAARRAVPGDPTGLRSGLLYLGLIFLSGALLQKFDLVIGTLALAAVLAVLAERDAWGYACVALATLVKGFPILMLPALVAIQLSRSRRPRLLSAARAQLRPILNGLGWFAGVIVAWTLAVVIIAGWQPVIHTIGYHAGRATEIESLYANGMLALGWLPGLNVWTRFDTADLSRELVSHYVGVIGPLSDVLLLGLVLVVVAAVWRAANIARRVKRRPETTAHLALAATCALLLAFTITFRALPAHYVLVVLPLAAVLRLPQRRAQVLWMAGIVGVCVVGQVITNVWSLLVSLTPWGVALLSLRNIAWILAFAAPTVALWQWRTRTDRSREWE